MRPQELENSKSTKLYLIIELEFFFLFQKNKRSHSGHPSETYSPKASSIVVNIFQIQLFIKAFFEIYLSLKVTTLQIEADLINQMTVTQFTGCSMSDKQTQVIPGKPNASYLALVQLLQHMSLFKKGYNLFFFWNTVGESVSLVEKGGLDVADLNKVQLLEPQF